MCPDRQLISMYLDGELPSPWSGKMEAHLESCPECRAVFEGYRRMGARGAPGTSELSEETVKAAGERVWSRLSEAGAGQYYRNPDASVHRGRDRWPARSIWSRSVTLPVPAVAAAAVFVIVLFAAVMGTGNRPVQQVPQDSMAVLTDYMQMPENAQMIMGDFGPVPVQDMSGVLQYLSSQDYGGDFMVIRLPETRRFSRSGEPALINAADYSRRNVSR